MLLEGPKKPLRDMPNGSNCCCCCGDRLLGCCCWGGCIRGPNVWLCGFLDWGSGCIRWGLTSSLTNILMFSCCWSISFWGTTGRSHTLAYLVALIACAAHSLIYFIWLYTSVTLWVFLNRWAICLMVSSACAFKSSSFLTSSIDSPFLLFDISFSCFIAFST